MYIEYNKKKKSTYGLFIEKRKHYKRLNHLKNSCF